MTPQLEQLIDAIYNEIKSDPGLSGCSEFQVRVAILDAVRAYGEEVADTMLAVHHITELVKCLRLLGELQF
ncbi:hypothetical protein Gbem_3683 [Citrifermentans bemidjiense Bem]|uniref:Uncharacterized protein n=1 Tax=Citrifermentans bemidjiense (strain ATCC BAA-1014 / DSM 16622 / JCM 12645 / Bem) TaxID=404380 RepID=B5EDP7_CITBB|nr:hypothetical protein [Citrifermentans bemidjiense]ACH40675.1 hypothetical protein Gbem_3683 [Citrifermentans bemidjiense Bem]